MFTAVDGAGLFCGVLKHFLQLGSDCPKVLAATHFHDLFREDLLDPHMTSISFRHMEVMFTSSNGTVLDSHTPLDTSELDNIIQDTQNSSERKTHPGEKITYLYRVAKGLSLDSYAAKCAEIFGIPHRLAQRAQYVSQLISAHDLTRLLDEEMTEKEQADLADAEGVCRRFLAWDLDADQAGNVKERLRKSLGRESYQNGSVAKG